MQIDKIVSILVAAILLQSCGTATAVFWPKHNKTKLVKNQSPLRIRTRPVGAIVTMADGRTVLGPSPLEYIPSHTVRLDWTERSYLGPIVGTGLATIGMIVSFSNWLIAERDNKETTGWMLATGVSVVDMLWVEFMFLVTHQHNQHQRTHPTRTTIPKTVELQVQWDHWTPTKFKIQLPVDREVFITPSSMANFEQALLHWESQSDTSPQGEELYLLAQAHLAQASLSNAQGHTNAAISYLEQYLAAGVASRKREAEVRSLLSSLKKAPR